MFNFIQTFFKGFGGAFANPSKAISDYPYSFTYNADLDLDLTFFELDFFYRKVSTLKGLINFLSRETLKSGFGMEKDLDISLFHEQSKLDISRKDYLSLYFYLMRVLTSLLLYGFVIIRKSDRSILEPVNIQFNFLSPKSQKLVYIIYDDGINETLYYADELIILSYEPLPSATLGPSPVNSLSNEIKSLVSYSVLKNNFIERGGNLRQAIYIDSRGYSLSDQDNVRNQLKTEMVGVENAGRPLVVFSNEGRGNVQNLSGGYSTGDDELFKNISKSEIADAFGVSARYTNINHRTSSSQFDFERADEQLTAVTNHLSNILEILLIEIGINYKILPRFSVITQKKQNYEIRAENARIQAEFAKADTSSTNSQPKGEGGRPAGTPNDISTK